MALPIGERSPFAR